MAGRLLWLYAKNPALQISSRATSIRDGPRLSRKRHISNPAANHPNIAAMDSPLESNRATFAVLASLLSFGRPSVADRTSSSRTGNHRGLRNRGVCQGGFVSVSVG
jgi:hypothetical protein